MVGFALDYAVGRNPRTFSSRPILPNGLPILSTGSAIGMEIALKVAFN